MKFDEFLARWELWKLGRITNTEFLRQADKYARENNPILNRVKNRPVEKRTKRTLYGPKRT